MSRRGAAAGLVLGLALAFAAGQVMAQTRNPRPERRPAEAARTAKPAEKPAEPQRPPEALPFLPPLLRLSETIGGLAFLSELCGGTQDARTWRARMDALIEAEGSDDPTRQRLAGAFNAGFRGYEGTYRRCTASARAAIEVLLADSGRLSREISNRFGY